MEKLKGTGIAMVTPFDKNLEVDYSALEKLTEHLIQGGVDYLVVMGTTAESPTLNRSEKAKVLDHIRNVNNGRIPLVYGIGGNSTAFVKAEIEETNLDGVDAILSASPYYNKPRQEGIIQHYQTLADASSKPLILYNVPARTASNMEAFTTLKLSEHENIIAVKEASGSIEQVMEIINNKADDFLVISGEDALTLSIITAGGDGVISVSGNAYPKILSNMVSMALKEQTVEARKLHYQLLNITNMMFAEGNPAGVKAVLQEMSICNDEVRLPLIPIGESLRQKIGNEMENLKSLA